MYSPFHQLRKPTNQQNVMENSSQFPAHLVPGTLCIFIYLILNVDIMTRLENNVIFMGFQVELLQQLRRMKIAVNLGHQSTLPSVDWVVLFHVV